MDDVADLRLSMATRAGTGAPPSDELTSDDHRHPALYLPRLSSAHPVRPSRTLSEPVSGLPGLTCVRPFLPPTEPEEIDCALASPRSEPADAGPQEGAKAGQTQLQEQARSKSRSACQDPQERRIGRGAGERAVGLDRRRATELTRRSLPFRLRQRTGPGE